MQVGMTKDQGLYNKPSAAVHPGALAAGILPQYKKNLQHEMYDHLKVISNRTNPNSRHFFVTSEKFAENLSLLN